MEIQEMRATFGKLQDQTLSLKPGLNCIYAPNESGKSTWSHFLRIMLYGLSTRERGDLADKNRFAPWSGAAMRGQLQVADGNGTSLTLSRDTRRANAPMGQFACTYTGTATAVPGIDGQNAGETLLGVPREVFERSAFIRQSALAVDSDAELERRIAALITTGEEDVSYTEVQERLKKQLNRRRSNRANGQIPALEREIAELESQQAHRDDLTRQAAAAQQQLDSLTRQAEELQAQQALWQQQKQTERLRQYRQAQQDAEEAERKAAWLLAESADALPEDSLLNRLEGQCAALQESQEGLRQAQTAAQQAKAEADDAAARCAAHPLSPRDEAACQAQLDTITALAVPSPLPAIAGILLTICGGMGAVFHSTTLQLCLLIALALSGIGLTASSLLRRKNAIAAQAQADADRAALTAQLADYLPLLRQQQETARRSQEAAATAAGLDDLLIVFPVAVAIAGIIIGTAIVPAVVVIVMPAAGRSFLTGRGGLFEAGVIAQKIKAQQCNDQKQHIHKGAHHIGCRLPEIVFCIRILSAFSRFHPECPTFRILTNSSTDNGREKRYPCPSVQPALRSTFSCSVLSMPSASRFSTRRRRPRRPTGRKPSSCST